jgi:hypothetical protein
VVRRGFTLMEMMLVLLIVFMLMGLLLGGIHLVHGSVLRTADRATVQSLKNGAVQFKQLFNVYPPLVKDMGNESAAQPFSFDGQPPVTTTAPFRPRVYSEGADSLFLRTSPPAAQADMRFSIYSLPYYVLGVLDETVDGVAGPGMRSVRRDGSFEVAGKIIQPFYDVSRKANAVYHINGDAVRIVLRDRNEVAFRLYHWQHNDPVTTLADLNVPIIVGDPATDERLRSATWAIVAAGPNGVFGNEDQLLAQYPLHPQQMTIGAMQLKVGVSGDISQQVIQDKVRQQALSDNIVELLP